MKRYRRYKNKNKEFFPFHDPCKVKRILEERIPNLKMDYPGQATAKKLDSYMYDEYIKAWRGCLREVITFRSTLEPNKSTKQYDILMPECQVVSIGNGLEGISSYDAKELTKILFKGFKKTDLYNRMDPEQRMEF